MHIFTLKIIDAVKGKQTFEELVIDNDAGQLTQFECELIGTTYLTEYRTILSYMQFVADLKALPETKFRPLKGSKDGVKEYEFKSKHLRVYCIQKIAGKIVILCGKKTEQDTDLREFRSLKKQYLQSI